VPTVPTIVLVGQETDFPASDDSAVRAMSRCASCVVEADAQPAAMASATGVGRPVVVNATIGSEPGLYVTKFQVFDKREDWSRGDPELEIHLRGTQYSFYEWDMVLPPPNESWSLVFVPNGQNILLFSCAGEQQVAPKQFDVNSTGTFTPNVLIARAADMRVQENYIDPALGYQARTVLDRLDPPFQFVIVERDDAGACKESPDRSLGWRHGVSVSYYNSEYEDYNPSGVDEAIAEFGIFFGNGNDYLGYGGLITSFDALENASDLLVTDTQYARLWITSSGFHQADIPPEEDPAGVPVTVSTVQITPGSVTLSAGSSRTMSLIGLSAPGRHVSTASTPTWQSLNPGVATVSATGFVTGSLMGSATITGTLDGVTGSALVTVNPIVSLSGPGYAYNQTATVTATPGGTSGPMYYVWTYR
jgi:hypothetical protein